MNENSNHEQKKDGLDRLSQAYERMLGLVHEGVERFEQDGLPHLRERLDQAREKMVELGELSREEADRLSTYLQRDLEDAGKFLADTGEEFRTWLSIDASLIEARMLHMLASVADQTSLQLKQWAERARLAPYKTGEITGPGVLQCKACGEEVHFHKVGRIPPCPKCHGSEFQRTEDRGQRTED
ncbi:MAG: zinc ribbon-containing protein [Gammaproteobacteria bacterium SHHR-1]|uniref:zinc ribbon-containing protein n=1 Tax=Magnetovirga frankeli TaxID=947516 RepID=UPI0012931DD9|nr:zinc ribbon-containing protein [gamma proteobacterium SS-5]